MNERINTSFYTLYKYQFLHFIYNKLHTLIYTYTAHLTVKIKKEKENMIFIYDMP